MTAPSPFPQPLVASILLPVSLNLSILGTSYKQNHTIFVLVCLAYFTEHNVFKVHPCCSMQQKVSPVHGWIAFHRVYVPRFIYLLVCGWTLGLLPAFACCDSCCCEYCVQMFVQFPPFSSFRCIGRSGVVGSYGSSMFTLGESAKTFSRVSSCF